MKVFGEIAKEGNIWVVDVPLFDGRTQGRTRKEALLMAQDMVRSMLDDASFPIEGRYTSMFYFDLQSPKSTELIALALKRQRQKHGLSAEQVAAKIGHRSPKAYLRIENGKSIPTCRMLERLFYAMGESENLGLALYLNARD